MRNLHENNDGLDPAEGDLLGPIDNCVPDEEKPSMRNLHENNTPEISREDLDKYASRLCMIMPALSEGSRYEFVTLSDGRIGIVIENG